MSFATQTAGPTVGDILKWEVHPAYCREGRLLHNDSPDLGSSSAGAPVALEVLNPVGQPLKVVDSKYEFVRAGDEASATHICLQQKAIILEAEANTVLEVPALCDSPAIVANAKLPTNDIDGVALNWTTIKAQFSQVKFKDTATQIEEP